MFLSSDCAVVTSLATTKALTGCCCCPAIVSASWFVSDEPTMLKAGACAAETAGRLELADPLERPPTEDATALVFLTADITPFTMLTACAAYNIKNGIAFV